MSYTQTETKSRTPAHHPVQSGFLSKEDAAGWHWLRAGSHRLAKRGGVARFSLWHHCRLHKAPWLARWSEYWVRYCSSEPGTQHGRGAAPALAPRPFPARLQGKKEKEQQNTPTTRRFQASNAPSYIFGNGAWLHCLPSFNSFPKCQSVRGCRPHAQPPF